MKIDQRRTFKLIPLKEALNRIKKAVPNKPIEFDTIKSIESLGRVLGEDIIAEINLPDHDFSAMDGYAVKTEEIKNSSDENPVKLKVMGELFPPDFPTKSAIGSYETMYLACGAPIPSGADAVVRIEYARRINNEIIITKPVKIHRNIALTGEDVKKMNLVIPKNRVLRSQDIGLLVALNREFIKVVRKPKVAILSVGDELTQPFKNIPNKTPNNNAYIISSLVEHFNAEPILLGIAKDNLENIEKMIKLGLEKADIVITIAGCSVGLKDYVPDVLGKIGKPGIIFHGMAASAGKVSGVAVANEKPLIMLPGHVGSTIATFYLLVLPIINSKLGLGFKDLLPKINCIMDESISAKPMIDLILPVKVYNHEGKYHAKPLNKHLSVLKNLTDTNGYTLIESGKTKDKDEIIEVKMFSSFEFFNMES